MECEPVGAAFDIAASAGWYSAIAGLLAGFALIALLLPLDHESASDDPEEASSAVVEFVCAFLALVVLAFAYAVLAGRLDDDRSVAVAAHEQLLLGPALGLTTLLLLAGLYSVLGSYGANREVFRSARGVILAATATLGPIAVVVLQFSNTLDVAQPRSVRDADGCSAGGLTSEVRINLAIVLVALATLAIIGWQRERLPRWNWAGPGLAKAVLGFSVLTVVWTSLVVPFLSTSALTAAITGHATLVLVAVVTSAFSVIAWSMRLEDEPID
jgi:hypothetical protein